MAETTGEDPRRVIEEKDKLIKRQFVQIRELESELTAVREERDELLCELNKLRFELEMSELKRIKDGEDRRTPSVSHQSSICGDFPPRTPDTEDGMDDVHSCRSGNGLSQ